MSWDVFAMKFPKQIRSVNEIPDDFKPTPIGTRVEVIEAIRSEAPTATLDSFGWLTIKSTDYSITANLGTNDVCSDIMFEVRGSESVAYVIQRILKRLDVRGIETGNGEFLDLEGDPTVGFKNWSKYRDHVQNQVTRKNSNWLKSLPLAATLVTGIVVWLIYRRMSKARQEDRNKIGGA